MSDKVYIDKIDRLLRLAKLGVEVKEIDILEKQLEDTLKYVSHLNEIETSDIPPTSQISGNSNIFRDDEIKQSFTQEEALFNAKRKHKGYFIVDPVL